MNRKFIFAFFLLVTLTTVNAIPHKLLKRTTKFDACLPPQGSTTPPPLLQVSLSPDPPAAGQKDTVTVSGKFSEDITEDTMLAVVFAQQDVGIIGDPFITPACTGSGCPIKAGEQYTQTVEIQAPADLPNPYLLGAAVGNPDTQDVLGCAIATI
ncbi:16713_t:CDS:1 [Funneliformis mosseae]|uniref:Phosphatidylglycerol/phosphatidylinositol transfer protein n=1 Tax=Funneliformis mosseae TaxID=27381 RepID=A0A9N9H4X4_FUNMO|nr:16713_t:CDS:1 [Funneliformis mosseae]